MVYDIHRVWKAIPVNTGNMNQVHQLRVSVTPVGSERGRLKFAITRFEGHAKGEDKHLKEMAKEIMKDHWLRRFDLTGADPDYKFQSSNNAGWAGMMADKACGLYDVGFMDIHYPVGPVRVGSIWKYSVHLGNEGLEGKMTNWVRGNNELCSYRLDSVDTKHQRAKISFSVSATITANRTDFDRKAPITYSMTEQHSGSWTVDMKTGIPISYSAKRKVSILPTKAWAGQTEITETTAKLR